MSGQISKTVPLTINDNTRKSGGILGPTPPGTSWEQYEQAVTNTLRKKQGTSAPEEREELTFDIPSAVENRSRFSLQQIEESRDAAEPVEFERPKSIINETVELSPVEEKKNEKMESALSPEVTERNRDLLEKAMRNDPRWQEVQDSVADMSQEERDELAERREESVNELKKLPDEVRHLPENLVGFANSVGDVILHPDKLFDDQGIMNPDNWPLIGSTQRDRQIRREREEYRAANPMPEDAFNPDGTTGQSIRQIYEGLPGWMQGRNEDREGYDFGEVLGDMNTTYQDEDGVWHVVANPSGRNYWDELTKPIGWYAQNSIDDGSMTRESLLAPNMTTQQYIAYRQAGVPGRPIEELLANPDAVWNKRDEQQDYNFVPYIEDDNQLKDWNFRNLVRDTSNIFKEFGDIREDWTDATINYKGNRYSRDDMYREATDWYNNTISKMSLDDLTYYLPGSPNIDGTYAPMVNDLLVHLPDGDVVITTPVKDVNLESTGYGDETIATFYGTDQILTFDSGDEARAFFRDAGNYEFRSRAAGKDEQPNAYAQFPTLEYDQADGQHVSLTYPEVNELMEMRESDTLPIDYGPFNIAKDASERKELTESLSNGNIGDFFSDLTSTMTDTALSSLPIMFKRTAWPMSFGDAATTLQNLDPKSYDSETGAMLKRANDPSGPVLAQESLAALSQPWFERIAGDLGGRGLSKIVTKKVLGDNVNRIPYMFRYLSGSLGEGWEEPISDINEEASTYPFNMMYANPVDENGNQLEDGQEPVYDNATGLQLRDPNTPFPDRFRNWLEQSPESFAVGTLQSLPLSLLRMRGDINAGTGPVRDYREYRQQKAFDKMHDLPVFRQAKNESDGTRVYIRPEDIGSYDPNEAIRNRDANSLRDQ